MAYLKENGFRCIAVRDLEPYVDRDNLPADPMLGNRQPPRPPERLALPPEVKATRSDLRFWLENMLVAHRYTWAEAARVCGWSTNQVQAKAAELVQRAVRRNEKLAHEVLETAGEQVAHAGRALKDRAHPLGETVGVAIGLLPARDLLELVEEDDHRLAVRSGYTRGQRERVWARCGQFAERRRHLRFQPTASPLEHSK